MASVSKWQAGRVLARPMLWLLLTVLTVGCSNPRYRSDVSVGIDQRIAFERGMDLEALILQRLEEAERGLEVRVAVTDLGEANQALQNW